MKEKLKNIRLPNLLIAIVCVIFVIVGIFVVPYLHFYLKGTADEVYLKLSEVIGNQTFVLGEKTFSTGNALPILIIGFVFYILGIGGYVSALFLDDLQKVKKIVNISSATFIVVGFITLLIGSFLITKMNK